jgi:poly(3-hydroxybutyrate) depolymerase
MHSFSPRARVASMLLLGLGSACGSGKNGDDSGTGGAGGAGGDASTSTADATTTGAGGAGGDAASTGAGGGVPTGKLVRTFEYDGREREVVVHVPASVDGSKPVPVVFMLHGTSGDGGKFYEISNWVEKAEAEGFIAVFPSSLSYCLYQDENLDGIKQTTEYTVTTKWCDGKLGSASQPLCTDAEIAMLPSAKQAEITSTTLTDDVGFLRAIVDGLGTVLPVDAQRVYLAGFSNGGNMAARAAVEASDLFAAAHVAGGNLQVDTVPPRTMPVLLSLGSADENALSKTGVLSDPTDNLTELPIDETLFDAGVLGPLTAWSAALGVDGASPAFTTFMANGTLIGQYDFGPKPLGEDGSLRLLLIDGAPHCYPNGTVGGSPVVMTEIVWPFFESVTLNAAP